MTVSNVLITGVSSGIGEALAEHYLQLGWQVFGISRQKPDSLCQHSRMKWVSQDLTDHAGTVASLPQLLGDLPRLELVVLNAGALGKIGDMCEIDLDAFREMMEINVWSCKTVLDFLLAGELSVAQVVAISSGAAVNGNRGWNAYSVSKAALNMLTKLYAVERPEVHFSALAPGLVDTAMQDYLCEHPEDVRFPSLEVLRSKRNTIEMPTPTELAPRLAEVISRVPSLLESGGFLDIRKMPETS